MKRIRTNHKAHYEAILASYFGLCSREIAMKTGLTQKHVQKLLKKYDWPRQKQGDAAKDMKKNSFWMGGRYNPVGRVYERVKAPDGHPYAHKNGYISQHRLAMEKHLGRYLLPTEVVHHRNGDRLDNHIENLELFESNGAHMRTHVIEKTLGSPEKE